MSALSRRRFLSLTATGAIGSALVACGPSPVSGPTPPPARATIGADQTEWNRVLAAAKQEGTVIVAGPPGDSFREALTAFSKAYPEIRLDYTGFAGRDFAPRLIGEREAGQYLWDIHAAGPDTALLVLKPQGAYDPLGPALLLPEVTDDAKWLNGFTAGFLDNERQFVYAFAGYVVPVGSVNREFVPESELSSMEQLLDPRWRGKISWEDPRATGLGSADAGHLLMVL